MKRRIDDFRPYTAKQIAFLNRGKGIDVPDVQSAIEEVKSMMDKIDVPNVQAAIEELRARVEELRAMIDEIDHLHQGDGENSIQLGPNSKASADYSITIGSSAYTDSEARRSIVLGRGTVNT